MNPSAYTIRTPSPRTGIRLRRIVGVRPKKVSGYGATPTTRGYGQGKPCPYIARERSVYLLIVMAGAPALETSVTVIWKRL